MRTILAAITVGVLILAGASAYAATDPAAACKEGKAKTAGKKAFDLLKAFGKNEKKSDTVKLAAGISKADSKFAKGFSKAESKGGCDTTGDAAAVSAMVDDLVDDVVTAQLDPCCASNPGALGFVTIDVGTERPKCGEMRNYRCLGSHGNFQNHVCIDDGDESECDFGPCIVGPNVCTNDFSITCTDDPGCAGTCGEITSAGFPFDIDCGGLYTGGGLNSVPLPLAVPDMGVTIHQVTECNNGILTVGPVDQPEIGDNYGPDGQGLNCSRPKSCDPGTSPNPGGRDGNGLCRIEEDCGCVFGDGCCVEHCLFGPLLPIPNSVTPPTSVCVRNVIAKETSGTVDCTDGGGDISIPIASVIHVTGDLLNDSAPPDVVGLQPCPLCTKVCVGGGLDSNEGFPCENDSDCDSNDCSESTQCIAGPNDGLPCRPQTSRLDVHKCCKNGSNNLHRCETDADCAPPPGPAPRCESGFNSCTDDSDCILQPNDKCIKCVPGCTSFPTSHDCPPDPGQDITFRIGGLPIDFSLTDEFNSVQSVDMSSNGRRVFCGYCRDVIGTGSLRFEGDLAPGAPTAVPPADGNGVACFSDDDCGGKLCVGGGNDGDSCTDDSDCSPGTCTKVCIGGPDSGSSCTDNSECSETFTCGDDEYETCTQRNPGAFSKAAATTFNSGGSTDGQWLSDNQCHDATLVGIFCIPPTFDATIDNAGDLPGPSVSNLVGKQRLRETPADLDPGDTGDICGP